MYWVRPPRVLSTGAGMHRFLWDLTYPAPEVLTRDYPISAIYHDTPLYPLGATVLPGQYKVVLTVGGKSYTQTLEVKMDPRVKDSPDDLRKHFELDRKIAEALRLDYAAVQQVRSLRRNSQGLRANLYHRSTEEHRGNLVPDAIKKSRPSWTQRPRPSRATRRLRARFLSTPEGRSLARG
jgi:hypothetical protein